MIKELVTTTLGRFRIIAFIEGLSFLVLLFFAMPMKYFFKMPEFVRVVGMLHGVLFVLFMFLLLQVTLELRWKAKKVLYLILMSVLPFGTFWADKRLLRSEQ